MADTTTTILGLTKPAVGVQDPVTDWGAKLNTNLDTLDAKWTSTTPSTLASGSTAAAGVSLAVARADHVHAMPTLFPAAGYRRPVLQYNSTTVVNIESGLDGTSGDVVIVFPDGTTRTDSTTSRVQCNLGQNAVLSGTAKSGLRTGAVANNTWYAIYAVKQTDNANNIVAVADVTLPLQANFANLNTYFGTNGWVYLGLIRNGDGAGAATVIMKFVQSGNITTFYNAATPTRIATNVVHGLELANGAGAANVTYTYAAGTGTAQIPNNITMVWWGATNNGTVDVNHLINNGAGSVTLVAQANIGVNGFVSAGRPALASDGASIAYSSGGNITGDIFMQSFVDGVLGIGGNPLL